MAGASISWTNGQCREVHLQIMNEVCSHCCLFSFKVFPRLSQCMTGQLDHKKQTHIQFSVPISQKLAVLSHTACGSEEAPNSVQISKLIHLWCDGSTAHLNHFRSRTCTWEVLGSSHNIDLFSLQGTAMHMATTMKSNATKLHNQCIPT